jgi:hypothetical protein
MPAVRWGLYAACSSRFLCADTDIVSKCILRTGSFSIVRIRRHIA